MRKLIALMAFVFMAGIALSGMTTHFALDCREGARPIAAGGEELCYDVSWYTDADQIRIMDDGLVVETGTAGSALWRPESDKSSSHVLVLEVLRNGQVVATETAEFALGYIRNVTARQLWPHKKAEVCFEVAADIGEVMDENAALVLTCGNNTAKTVLGDVRCEPGLHRVVWDMEADGVSVSQTDAKFVVRYDDGSSVVVAPVVKNGSWSSKVATPSSWTASANNVFLGVTPVFSGSRYNESGRVSSSDPLSRLSDGVVNAKGTSYGNTVGIVSGTLTWTLSKPMDLKMLRINTHWGDGGRDGIKLNSIQIQKSGSSTWETLANSSLSYGLNNDNSGSDLECVFACSENAVLAMDVVAVKFDLGTQDNSGSGFTEFEAVGATVQTVVDRGPFGVSAPTKINTTSSIKDGMAMARSITLGYSPIDAREVQLQIDGTTVLSSDTSGEYVWMPQSLGAHALKHIAGTNVWMRTVNVTELAFAAPVGPNPPTEPDANIKIPQDSQHSFASTGGADSIRTEGVNGYTGSFSVSKSDDWITINSAEVNWKAGRSIVYTVAANEGVEERTGYVYVGGHVHTITQAGVGAELSSYSTDVEAEGGEGCLTVLADAGASWNARPNVDWITISPTTGTGEKDVTFTVAPWNDVSIRSATITVAGETFTVNQIGRHMKLDKSVVSMDYIARTVKLSVSALPFVEWDAESSVPWISVIAIVGGGKGDGTVTLSVAENPDYLPRTASVRVGTETVTISQAKRSAAALGFATDPAQTTTSATGGAGAVKVTATPGLPWSAQSETDWIILSPSTITGTGNGDFAYIVEPNSTMTERSGTIKVSPETASGLAAKTIVIVQSAAEILEGGHEFAAKGETFEMDVSVSDGIKWSVAAVPDWVTIEGGKTRTGPGVLRVTAKENLSIEAREATIIIAGRGFKITQSGRTVRVDTLMVGAPMGGGDGAISVIADANVIWSASPSDLWISIWGDDDCDYDANGDIVDVGSGVVNYYVDWCEESELPRTGWIQIGDKRVSVRQTRDGVIEILHNPIITPLDGSVFATDTCTVTITCATPNAVIYYSTNGQMPLTTESCRYKGPFTITGTTTIKAVAVRDEEKSEYVSSIITKIDPDNYTDAVVGKDVTGLDEPVTVSATWVTDFLVQHFGTGKVDSFRQLFGGDLAAALAKPTGKHGPSGEVRTVWDDYVAGTDPTDPASVFTTTIAIVDGKVVLDWSPNLNLGSVNRLYRVKSKLKLSDTWTCPPVADHHFFMTEVALPDGKTQTASPGVIGNVSSDGDGEANKLAHRWSFNGNLNDSVGNRTAMAVGSVSSDGTTYTLSGGYDIVAYIDLGTGLFADGVTEFTIETWATPYATGWMRIWDMADQFGQCWNGKDNLMGVRDHDEWTSYTENVKTYIAVVCTALSSGGWSLVYYHLDAETGATLSSYASTIVGSDWSPQKVGVNALLLGKSNASWDPYGNASYDEFRIWNKALSEDELKKSVEKGPDTLP